MNRIKVRVSQFHYHLPRNSVALFRSLLTIFGYSLLKSVGPKEVTSFTKPFSISSRRIELNCFKHVKRKIFI